MLMIDDFRKDMEKPKEIYTKELEKFVKRYDFLGEFTIVEEPDIDTADYFFCFKNLNGTRKEILKLATSEIYNHMVRFSKDNGIDEFSKNAHIFIKS